MINTLTDWRRRVGSLLPLYGHRNWIAVVDSAYPLQSSAGVETIVADVDQAEAVDFVIGSVNAAPHVRPIVYIDAELAHLDERDAPGIDAYRTALASVLADVAATPLIHEDIIKQLDEAGKTFQVLVIKTRMTLPYTSVFIQLDCGYWDAASETRLRSRLASQ